jgi:hypothetical protein
MNTNIRFDIDENGFVIDSINLNNSGKWQAPEDTSYAETDLRDCVLLNRLWAMTGKFMVNLRPFYKDQPTDNQRGSLYLTHRGRSPGSAGVAVKV